MNSSTYDIVALLHRILAMHFVDLHSITVVYEKQTAIDNWTDRYVINLEQALLKLDLPVFWIGIEKDSNATGHLAEMVANNMEIGCQGYITVLQNVYDFLDIVSNVIGSAVQRQRSNRFLFLMNANGFAEIFSIENLLNYPDHMVVVAQPNHNFELWTQTFVGNAKRKVAVFLDRYNSQVDKFEFDGDRLFLDKQHNLEGYHLNVTTITYLPSIICSKVEPGHGNADAFNTTDQKSILIDGIEALLIENFCKLRNCVLKVNCYPPSDWGDIYPNKTADGLFGALYRKECDFGIGDLYTWYSEQFDTSSPPTGLSTVNLLVPQATPYASPFTPLLPFSLAIWLCLLLSLFGYILAIYYSERFYRSTHATAENAYSDFSLVIAVMTVSAIFMQQSTRTFKSSTRLLIGFLLTCSIVIGNSYGGSLASVLTITRYENVIDTKHEFVESNLKWGAISYAWIYSLIPMTDPDSVALRNTFELITDTELYHNALDQQHGIPFETVMGTSNAFPDLLTAEAIANLDLVKETLYSGWIVAYAVRGWPLLRTFNEFILNIHQHGLLIKWESLMADKYSSPAINIIIADKIAGRRANAGPTKIKIAHIAGVVYVLMFGCVLGMVIFIGELCYHSIMTKRLQCVPSDTTKFNLSSRT